MEYFKRAGRGVSKMRSKRAEPAATSKPQEVILAIVPVEDIPTPAFQAVVTTPQVQTGGEAEVRAEDPSVNPSVVEILDDPIPTKVDKGKKKND